MLWSWRSSLSPNVPNLWVFFHMDILSKLGIDWRLLIAQIVNFLILLYVLKRFAYAPILRFLEERREKIERGIKRAEESEKINRKAKADAEELVLSAKRQAKDIMSEAHIAAQQSRESMLVQAKEESKEIILAAKRQSEKNRLAYVSRFREDIASLVVLAAEKIVRKKWGSDLDKQFIEKTVIEIAGNGQENEKAPAER